MNLSLFVFLLNSLLLLASCNPLGESSSTGSNYTPGLTDNLSFTITPSVDANTSVTPNTAQLVVQGESISFSLSAVSAYSVSTTVGGDCPSGSWAGSVYTTGVITEDCSISFSSNLSGAIGPSTPLWAQLRTYWGLEETVAGTVNSGASDFADSGPLGTNYGEASGVVTYGATGKIGKSISLAASGCVSVPADTVASRTQLSAMAWIKSNSASIGNILSFYNSANSFQGWALILNNTAGKASFWGGTGTSNSFLDTNASNLNDGNWHHFAAVVNGTSLKLFVDGALDSTFVIGSLPNYSGPGVIGADGDCLQKITGQIDEVAIWSGSLSDANITAIYNNQNNP